ncbi:MAG: asparagine synthase (glutamine-hydrolyzing) [Flavobacteriaceae bacterium]|nr:asparagine synthase (glutamine-hydrolyzing) [Flavobacteriaceae bacterium]
MCGIIGSLARFKDAGLTDRVTAGRECLIHRGPNDQGLSVHESNGCNLVLGHTRLSIIDLSEDGRQPMQSIDKRYTVVFNGEIYNYLELKKELKELSYRFDTNSDTEVLLVSWQEWGKRCLSRLNGMFSFVIFDSHRQILTCVRDPFGIKPLFYCFNEKGFHFASELSAVKHLLGCKPKLNFQRAYDYLVYGRYDDCEETFYKGVMHLLPGHIMNIDCSPNSSTPSSNEFLNKSRIERWWWPNIEENSDLSFPEASEQLRALFLSNVRLHMRSDVALGAALSGGIDSSAVVCAMRYLEPDMPIHTFSYIAEGSSVNEEKWVDVVNNQVNAIENKILLNGSDIMSDLPTVIKAQGEPFMSASVYSQFRVFKEAKDKGITVTLDGQGADELLAGYESYVGAKMHSLSTPGQFPRMLRFLSNWRKRSNNSLAFAMSHLLDNFSSDFINRFIYTFHKSPLPPWINKSQVEQHEIRPLRPAVPKPIAKNKNRRLVEKLRYALAGYRLGALLRHADRNSMYWSVESRVPFLTQDMAQFILQLPEDYLFSPKAETKSVFRHAMRDIVPAEILSRKDKIGFVCPETQVEGMLLSELKKNTSPKLFLADKVNDSLRPDQIWRLVNFSTWSNSSGVCN